jgi:hypothetical protein
MRKKLAAQAGERKRFRGVFVRTGKKLNYHGYSEDTLLLRDIVELAGNRLVADHVWMTFSKRFQDFTIRAGDHIEFDARIREYKKGYVNKAIGINNRKSDYRLSHPTKVAVIKRFMPSKGAED